MRDCRECVYALHSNSAWLCMVMQLPKPTSYMRDPRSECGLEGALFEPIGSKKYAEFDDD
jgi:hypothetical protein